MKKFRDFLYAVVLWAIAVAVFTGIAWLIGKVGHKISESHKAQQVNYHREFEQKNVECSEAVQNIGHVLILNGGFRQQTGEVIGGEYDGTYCKLQVKLDKNGAVIAVKQDNYEAAEKPGDKR